MTIITAMKNPILKLDPSNKFVVGNWALSRIFKLLAASLL